MNERVAPSVGIDVSQETLDVATSDAQAWQVKHHARAMAALVRRLSKLQPERIIVESTGRLQEELVVALMEAQLPVVVVNPRQVRDFAKATGALAKTDRLDAQLLARFGEAVKPPLRLLPDEATRELAALVARRRQLQSMIVAETHRRGPYGGRSNSTSPIWKPVVSIWIRSCKTGYGRVRCGRSRRTCCAACRVSVRRCRPRSWPSCPSWVLSLGARSRL